MNRIKQFVSNRFFKLTLILVFIPAFFRGCSPVHESTAGFPIPWLEIIWDQSINFALTNNWLLWLLINLIFFYLLYLIFKDRVSQSPKIRLFFNIAFWVAIIYILLSSPIGGLLFFMGGSHATILPTDFLCDIPGIGTICRNLESSWAINCYTILGQKTCEPGYDVYSRISYVLYVLVIWGLCLFGLNKGKSAKSIQRLMIIFMVLAIFIFLLFIPS